MQVDTADVVSVFLKDSDPKFTGPGLFTWRCQESQRGSHSVQHDFYQMLLDGARLKESKQGDRVKTKQILHSDRKSCKVTFLGKGEGYRKYGKFVTLLNH